MPVTLPTQSVRVELGPRSYDIEIGQRNLATAGSFLSTRQKVTHAVIIADARVERPHAHTVRDSLQQQGIRTDLLLVPSGEKSKSLAQAEQLWNALLDCHADRRSVIVAVGGGVIGDLAGFVAASFTRGVPFLQVPTTLLAQVDSSVGGKVGINLPRAKNMVGAFWQPSGVLIDTEVLKTLPEREYRSGLAEVVKYGVILDADFFTYLEDNVSGLLGRHHDILQAIVKRSCELKALVVTGDERDDTGLRAVLNYGHTFGHAIEAVAGYEAYLHGEAVAMGMTCAARLAAQLGRVHSEFVLRQRNLLESLGLPVTILDLNPDELLAAMSRDKKTEHGQLRFVLPAQMGKVELVGGIAADAVRSALQAS